MCGTGKQIPFHCPCVQDKPWCAQGSWTTCFCFPLLESPPTKCLPSSELAKLLCTLIEWLGLMAILIRSHGKNHSNCSKSQAWVGALLESMAPILVQVSSCQLLAGLWLCWDADVKEVNCAITVFDLVVSSPTCLHSEWFSSLACLYSKSFSWNNVSMRESICCSVRVVGIMAAKLVSALKFLDVPTVGWTWIGLVYTGDVADDVCVQFVWCMHAGGVVWLVWMCVYAWHVARSNLIYLIVYPLPSLPFTLLFFMLYCKWIIIMQLIRKFKAHTLELDVPIPTLQTKGILKSWVYCYRWCTWF